MENALSFSLGFLSFLHFASKKKKRSLKIYLSEREFEILNILAREITALIIATKKKRFFVVVGRKKSKYVERERSVRGGSVRDEGVKLVPKESE